MAMAVWLGGSYRFELSNGHGSECAQIIWFELLLMEYDPVEVLPQTPCGITAECEKRPERKGLNR